MFCFLVAVFFFVGLVSLMLHVAAILSFLVFLVCFGFSVEGSLLCVSLKSSVVLRVGFRVLGF